MAILGEYIAILGVDIEILGVDMAILGVDIEILGVDIADLGLDISILNVNITILRADIIILGVDIAILMRQKKEGAGYRGRGGGGVAISHVRCVEAGWSTRAFADTRSHMGRGAPYYKPILGVRSGRGLLVEKPYDVASEDVGWIFDFTTSPETINRAVPDGRLQNVGGQIESEHDKHRQ